MKTLYFCSESEEKCSVLTNQTNNIDLECINDTATDSSPHILVKKRVKTSLSALQLTRYNFSLIFSAFFLKIHH